jgi:hypothetical protein
MRRMDGSGEPRDPSGRTQLLQEGVEKPVVIVRCAQAAGELTVYGAGLRQCESNAQRIPWRRRKAAI